MYIFLGALKTLLYMVLLKRVDHIDILRLKKDTFLLHVLVKAVT